jgi:hypothetical protein
MPPGITVVPPVKFETMAGSPVLQFMTVSQHVIPRYAGAAAPSGQSRKSIGPAGQLIGWGPISVIRGNAQTQQLSVKAVVVTEDFGKVTAQWSSGEHEHPEYRPAILRPVVRDCTIAGHDETGTNYQAAGVVNNDPGRWNPAEKFPDLYGGLFLQASGAVVESVTAFYIPGTAYLIGRSGTTNTGAFGPWDVEKTVIRNCDAHRAYRGFEIRVVDAVVGQLQGYALRDFGIKFVAGSTQIDGAIHFWGVSPGAAVWFANEAGPCWGGPFYAESSRIGVLVESAGNQLGPIFSKACQEANIKLLKERNTLGPIDIEVARGATGIIVGGQFNKLLGGSILLAGPTAVGVRVLPGANSGNGLVIRDVRFLGASATAGTALTTEVTLHNAKIEAHIQNVGVGIDLYAGRASRIGMANDIDITTTNVTTPINLPPRWHASNRIRINGVLQRPGR